LFSLQAVLKAIDKGEVINSGVYQVSKDGSVGKSNPDGAPIKQSKLGLMQFSYFLHKHPNMLPQCELNVPLLTRW
jgi:hypothetical protein